GLGEGNHREPRMRDRVVLVTGATDGVGKETARELAARGAHILVHGRDPGTTERTAARIAQAGARATPLVADLASLGQVRRLADDVKAATPRLHVLVNNAGVYARERRLSEDGYELTFAVNHLAHFLLTLELMELLQASAPARVVTVSSMTHTQGRLDFADLMRAGRYDGYDAYATSKLANVLFTRALAARLAGTGVTANALHPGVVATKLLRAGFAGASGMGAREGAATSVYVATAPEVAEVSGGYFVSSRRARPAAVAASDALAEQLWAESERLVREALAAAGAAAPA
ncbi:MAG TPA: SDR family oxidoreductase, partial [Gemmatimonadaceae bacterium]|nr:SDR family oxidoreductase [Gemmatimonadaceae bacterium]